MRSSRKVQRTFELAREMGATTVVEYFLVGCARARKGVYDWAHADLVVDHARNQGLTVIARLGYVPEWAPEGLIAPVSGRNGLR
jgi:beta-galactosidase GanA